MSKFQINDIELDIAPEQIQISRKSFNHQWQTLRTTSSIKSKSGFSAIDINCQIKFTDSSIIDGTNGYEKLQMLVAQFRVTPFCYVDNSFLRDSIVAGDDSRAMALAVKSVEISKDNSTINVLNVSVNFAWFNYLPYLHDFVYKQDIFVPAQAYDPKHSKAWKRLYRAEMKRNDYWPARGQSLGTGLGQWIQLSTPQYATVKKEKWREVADIQRGLEDVRLWAEEQQAATHNGPYAEEQQYLTNELGEDTASKIWEIVQGAGSSMFPESDQLTYQQLAQVLKDGKITATISKEYDLQFTDIEGTIWSPIVTNKGLVKMASEPTTREDLKKNNADEDESILVSRKVALDFASQNIIPTGISIGFSNILATIPLSGHSYPTYQHIGSTDATVVISFTTTSRDAIQALSKLYSLSEDQARKFRNIPQGHRNIELQNEITSMFGLREFIFEDFVDTTVPGQPGTYSGYVTLVNNPVTVDTREQIYPGASFTTRFDIRNIISKVLMENLTLDKQAIGFGVSHLGGLTIGNRERVTDSKKAYEYTPRAGAATDNGRDSQFKELCLKYGAKLGEALDNLILVVQRGGKSLESGPVAELFSLTNADVVGIEKLQADLFPIFQSALKSTSLGQTHVSVFGKDLDTARRNAARSMKTQYDLALKELQRLEYNAGSSSEKRYVEAAQDSEFDLANAVSTFIDNYLDDWIMFSTQFLDKIQSSGAIELPQFEKVRDALLASTATVAAGVSYPDFPLAQVMEDLQMNEPKAYDQFREFADALSVRSKNLGDEALINPDFYFFNEVEAQSDRFIESKLVNKAIDAIKVSHNAKRTESEKSFIEDEYAHMLGTQKVRDVQDAALKEADRDPEFWSEARKNNTKDLTQAVQESTKEFVFYPDDLFAGDPILSTIAEASEGDGIALEPIKSDGTNFISNERSSETLQAPDNARDVQHDFGWEAIDYLANHSHEPPAMPDSNKTSKFKWPCDKPIQHGGSRLAIPQRTGRFGERDVTRGSKNHKGIDIAALGKTKALRDQRTLETFVKASATGKIIYISNLANRQTGDNGTGIYIKISHPENWQTRYMHLQADVPQTIELSNAFRRGETVKVEQGQILGKMGGTNGNGNAYGPHLHFEMLHKGQKLNPEHILAGKFSKISSLPATIDPQSESLFTKSVDQFEKDLHNGQGYSMMRAYPAFKLYFIESDLGERKRFGFDDFFGYNAVKDIAVIRSRKVAADLCVIQLTNVSGVLSNRKFQASGEGDTHKDTAGKKAEESTWRHGAANTTAENPIASMMLQPGIQIQLRLGYNNNPEELEKVFNGVITDVAFSENDDLVEITCQSFAIELVQTTHGESKDYGGFLRKSGATGQILENLMGYPEVVHFGRWEGGEAQNTAYGVLKDRWNFTPKPQEDNIFAPTGRGWRGIWDSTGKYTIKETTIWDTFQEMTLRHPGYVACAVPYDGKWGPRMTMFFGCPEQMYFARDPSFKEDNTIKQLEKLVDEATERTRNSRSDIDNTRDPNKTPTSKVTTSVADKTRTEPQNLIDARDFWLKKVIKNFTLDKGITKSFRNYHVLTSTLHIMHNDIQSSAHNTFNTATIQYKNSMTTLGEKVDTFKEAATSGLLDGKYKTFTLRCDAALADEDVREGFTMYENCRGFEQAKRYALATLTNSLKEGYRGSVISIGNPRIKPYDICYIFDEYTDMFGPIEVEQVVHRFSQETGFVTEITPDMVVNTNRISGLSTADAMGLAVEGALRKIGLESTPSLTTATTVTSVANTVLEYAFAPFANMFFNSDENTLGAGGDANPFGLVGVFIFKKLLTRSQLAHPIRYSPLVKNGQSMLGGVPGPKIHGSFSQGIKTWVKDSERGVGLKLGDLYDKLDPNNWFGVSQGELSSLVRGEVQG